VTFFFIIKSRVMGQDKRISELTLRKRKMMLMMPLPVVAMLVLGFIGLDGGRGGAPKVPVQKGINMSLPTAQFDPKAKPVDKLGLYQQAAADSARLREKMKQDPYAVGRLTNDSVVHADIGLSGMQSVQANVVAGQAAANAKVEQVLRQVEQLKNVVGRSVSGFNGAGVTGGSPFGRDFGRTQEGSEERMRQVMDGLQKRTGPENDPEMDRIDAMLNKLIRIQHPEGLGTDGRAVDTVGDSVHGYGVARVEVARPEPAVRMLDRSGSGTEATDAGFMEIGDKDGGDSADRGLGAALRDAAIGAVIDHDQTLTAGSTVGLRLSQEAVINGVVFPANTLVYGMATVSGERLMISISSIRVGQAIVPVALQVYDLDGLAGIRVPGAVTRDVSKESADEAINGLGIASVDPSLSAQAASAGLQFAKSLASRKVRLVRVSVPAGYRVLLRNTRSITH